MEEYPDSLDTEETGEVYTFPNAYGLNRPPIRSRFTADRPQLDGLQGVEIESAVVHVNTGLPINMTPYVHEIAERLREQGRPGITPETCTHVVEQNGTPGTMEEVEASFVEDQLALSNELQRRGLIALPIGMLPHGGREAAEERLWAAMHDHPNPFYRRVLIPRDGEALRSLAGMSGLQSHTEERHGETAVTAVRALSLLAPLFTSLSASSPLINGTFRGRHSERMEQKKNLPAELTGLIPEAAVHSYASMRDFLHQSSQDPRRLSISPGYYWVRQPRVELGTVEISTMDAIPDPEHALWMCRLSRSVVQAVARDMSEGRALPAELFGDGQLSPDNRAWVYRTFDQLQVAPVVKDARVTDLGGRKSTVTEFLGRVMDWAETSTNDRTQIGEFLEGGTVSERMINKLRLSMDRPEEVEDHRIKDLSLQWAHHYRRRLQEMSTEQASSPRQRAAAK